MRPQALQLLTTCFQWAHGVMVTYPGLSYHWCPAESLARFQLCPFLFFILSSLYYIGRGGAVSGGKWKPRELHRLTSPGQGGAGRCISMLES